MCCLHVACAAGKAACLLTDVTAFVGVADAMRGVLQRLVAHAEEIAYNDPPSGAAEQLILNQHLYRLLRHNKLSAFQRFVQQVTVPSRMCTFAKHQSMGCLSAASICLLCLKIPSRLELSRLFNRSCELLSCPSKLLWLLSSRLLNMLFKIHVHPTC